MVQGNAAPSGKRRARKNKGGAGGAGRPGPPAPRAGPRNSPGASRPANLGSQMTPVAVAYGTVFEKKDPVIRSVSDGIVVSHVEFMTEVKASIKGQAMVHSLHPDSFPTLKGLSKHFQQFRLKSINFHYRTEMPTSKQGKLYLGIYKQPDDPYITRGVVESAFGATPTAGFLDFIRSLTGVKSIPLYIADKVGAVASQLARDIFNVVGLPVSRNASAAGSFSNAPIWDGLSVPGYMVAAVFDTTAEGSGTAVTVGELWADYEYEFRGLTGTRSNGAAFYSTSTTSSDLQLHSNSLTMLGSSAIRPVATNKIRVFSPGPYTVLIRQVGTSIVMDLDGLVILDRFQVDVTTTRHLRAWDVSDNALAEQTEGIASPTASTAQVQVWYLRLFYGDTIVIDALTSGTLSTSQIIISEGAPNASIVA